MEVEESAAYAGILEPDCLSDIYILGSHDPKDRGYYACNLKQMMRF